MSSLIALSWKASEPVFMPSRLNNALPRKISPMTADKASDGRAATRLTELSYSPQARDHTSTSTEYVILPMSNSGWESRGVILPWRWAANTPLNDAHRTVVQRRYKTCMARVRLHHLGTALETRSRHHQCSAQALQLPSPCRTTSRPASGPSTRLICWTAAGLLTHRCHRTT